MKQIVETDGIDIALRVQYARRLLTEGRFTDKRFAATFLENLANKAPKDDKELCHQADIHFANHRYAEAFGLFQDLLPRISPDAEIARKVGKCLEALDRTGQAAEWYADAVRIFPGSHALQAANAKMQHALGHFEEATAAAELCSPCRGKVRSNGLISV